MERVSVSSSNVVSVGHDPATNQLEVEFANGSVYLYEGVTAAEYTALITAPSVGKHLNGTIKATKSFSRVS